MSIFDRELKPQAEAIVKQVQHDFFDGNPVRINILTSGYKIDETDQCYVLGCRAGPSLLASNLFHEMGHLAEREPQKLLEKPHSGWGYYNGKYYNIGGNWGHEPDNDKSVFREARCFAYQLSLCRHYNIFDFSQETEDKEDTSAFNLVAASVYLPAWLFYKNRVVSESEQESLSYHESENKAIKILADYVEGLAATEFNFEAFCAAWKERMELLRG